MRVAASAQLRVWPGDEVIITARLPCASELSRLFVFAREGDASYSPYVPGIADALMVNGYPQMMNMLSLRLTRQHSLRELKFTADINGWITVMQELDGKADPLAKIRLQRRINPNLPWHAQLVRKIIGLFPL